MINKIIRYITLLVLPVYLLPLLLNVWQIKETVTTNNYAGNSFKILSTPQGYLQSGVKFNNGLLVTFGVLAIISLIIAGLLVTIFVLNDLKISKLNSIEKYLVFALFATTIVAVIIGLIAIIVNANISVAMFGSVAKLCPVSGFYVYVIGGGILSTMAFLNEIKLFSKK